MENETSKCFETRYEHLIETLHSEGLLTGSCYKHSYIIAMIFPFVCETMLKKQKVKYS